MAFINSNYSSYFNSQSLQYPSLSAFSSTTGFGTQGVASNSWLQTSNLLSSLLGSSSSLGQNWSALLGGSNSLSSLLGGQVNGQQNCPPPPPPPQNQQQYGQQYGQQSHPHGPPPPPPGHHHQQQNGYGQQNNWGGQNNWGNQNNWGGQQGGWGARQAVNNNCQPNQNYFGSQQVNNGGDLSQSADGEPISYTTSGGWTINVDNDKTTFTDPNTGQTLEYSGDPHEYLNGEHVKDWESSQRTVQLPDGTKVTLSATAANGLTTNTSIYDGNRNIQIDNTGNLITSDSTNYYDTQQREQAQYDGEVATLGYNADGGLIYTDLYNQDANFQVTSNYKDIARSDGNGAVTDLG
ncbi:MAG: hypothetical protein J0I12_30005 [Candidatus Eremiobacteraeota bacterium]|nr:hypothetical protein [Candidatus Eremiobacteraeota bacterium]